MNQRQTTRFDSLSLSEPLKKVSIILNNNKSIESFVINICSHGMRVSIPPENITDGIPGKNKKVNVCLIQGIKIEGTCVYVTRDQDNSISMGIYFFNPHDQNYLYELLGELAA